MTPFPSRARPPHHLLAPRELNAAVELIRNVTKFVRPELVQGSLFGSRARGDARADSDVDILLVFRRLPSDREPYATQAEDLAGEISRRTGIPITAWSVSLPDLDVGCRTPMLVDALEDSVPLWFSRRPLPRVRFTPADARTCVLALLQRVEEGSLEFHSAIAFGDVEAAARRARDDVVRLCTAFLLTRGVTRPRRAEAVRECAGLLSAGRRLPPPVVTTLSWAIESFGWSGRDDHLPIALPRYGAGGITAAMDWLGKAVAGGQPTFKASGAERRPTSGRARRGTILAPENFPW